MPACPRTHAQVKADDVVVRRANLGSSPAGSSARLHRVMGVSPIVASPLTTTDTGQGSVPTTHAVVGLCLALERTLTPAQGSHAVESPTERPASPSSSHTGSTTDEQVQYFQYRDGYAVPSWHHALSFISNAGGTGFARTLSGERRSFYPLGINR